MYKKVAETRTDKYYRLLILDLDTQDWITYNVIPMSSGGPGWFMDMDGNILNSGKTLELFKFVFPSRDFYSLGNKD